MGKKINLDKASNQTQLVGYMRNEILEELKLDIVNKEIIIYPGVIRHIKERHPYAFKKYFHRLIEAISKPDYVGLADKDSCKMEFIKSYKDNLLIALRVEEGNHIFISSMYIIEAQAVKKRLESGRLFKVSLGGYNHKEKVHYKNIKRFKMEMRG